MENLILGYTLDQKSWTDLRQNGEISFDEQAYALNILHTQAKYFKDIYLDEYLLQKIIKEALSPEDCQILTGRIPITCRPFIEDEHNIPDEGQVMLKLKVPDNQAVTVDYKTWLYLANSVNRAVERYDSTKNLNQILSLPEKELKIDSTTKFSLLNVLDPQSTMNLLGKIKLEQVDAAYEDANGELSEITDY